MLGALNLTGFGVPRDHDVIKVTLSFGTGDKTLILRYSFLLQEIVEPHGGIRALLALFDRNFDSTFSECAVIHETSEVFDRQVVWLNCNFFVRR